MKSSVRNATQPDGMARFPTMKHRDSRQRDKICGSQQRPSVPLPTDFGSTSTQLSGTPSAYFYNAENCAAQLLAVFACLSNDCRFVSGKALATGVCVEKRWDKPAASALPLTDES